MHQLGRACIDYIRLLWCLFDWLFFCDGTHDQCLKCFTVTSKRRQVAAAVPEAATRPLYCLMPSDYVLVKEPRRKSWKANWKQNLFHALRQRTSKLPGEPRGSTRATADESSPVNWRGRFRRKGKVTCQVTTQRCRRWGRRRTWEWIVNRNAPL